MTNWFIPRIAIAGNDWRKTISTLLAQLGHRKFAVSETFIWQDFDPSAPGTSTPDFQGMTVSNYTLYYARYCVINKFAFVNFRATATLAAPFATSIRIYVPWRWAAIGNQGGAARGQNAGAFELNMFNGASNEVFMVLQRANAAAFTAGTWESRFSFVGEIQ